MQVHCGKPPGAPMRNGGAQAVRKKPYIEVYCRILRAYTIIYANIHQRVLFCGLAALEGLPALHSGARPAAVQVLPAWACDPPDPRV